MQNLKNPEHEDMVDTVKREMEVISALEHPFIVDMVSSRMSEEESLMLMTIVKGGELWNVVHKEQEDGSWMSGISEADAKFYGLVIADTLAYMHQKNILFRDLKPENVLVSLLQSKQTITSILCLITDPRLKKIRSIKMGTLTSSTLDSPNSAKARHTLSVEHPTMLLLRLYSVPAMASVSFPKSNVNDNAISIYLLMDGLTNCFRVDIFWTGVDHWALGVVIFEM